MKARSLSGGVSASGRFEYSQSATRPAWSSVNARASFVTGL